MLDSCGQNSVTKDETWLLLLTNWHSFAQHSSKASFDQFRSHASSVYIYIYIYMCFNLTKHNGCIIMTWFSEKWLVMLNNLNWDFIHENHKSDFRILWYQVSQVISAGMEGTSSEMLVPSYWTTQTISQKTVVWLLTCFQLYNCFPCYSFLTSFGIYFLIGVAYKRIIKGAKGLEQIPHQRFWKELGNLQAVCWHYRNLEMKLNFEILIFVLLPY